MMMAVAMRGEDGRFLPAQQTELEPESEDVMRAFARWALKMMVGPMPEEHESAEED